jgi:hypothetical protein
MDLALSNQHFLGLIYIYIYIYSPWYTIHIEVFISKIWKGNCHVNEDACPRILHMDVVTTR